MAPGIEVAIVSVLGALAALLSAIAVYVRGAAKALEAGNATAASTQIIQEKQARDLSEAWGRIRALEGALAVVTGVRAPTAGSSLPSSPTGSVGGSS